MSISMLSLSNYKPSDELTELFRYGLGEHAECGGVSRPITVAEIKRGVREAKRLSVPSIFNPYQVKYSPGLMLNGDQDAQAHLYRVCISDDVTDITLDDRNGDLACQLVRELKRLAITLDEAAGAVERKLCNRNGKAVRHA